jgi:Type IIA topoisomerase (DNA gyrase/topo II, topoisomerase IV), A subunit
MIGANIGKFLNDIVGLLESKKTTDIIDISNQSSKEGIRIVLELRKGTDVENLKNMLYKKTRLEDTFGVNILAVADQRPETLSLKKVIEHHVDFQFEVTTRKYQTMLGKELDKKEVQEGLIKACDIIDLIIEIIRGSKNQKQVKECLTMGDTTAIKFKSSVSQKAAQELRFTQRQATAILEMRLYRLIGLEIEALMKDHEETMKKIGQYEAILNNYDTMADVIIAELDNVKKEYGRKRRTAIENAEEVVFEEKKIEEMPVYFMMDRFGYVKTVDKPTYDRNSESINAESKYVFKCLNTDKICLFTDTGKMHTAKILDLPFGRFRDKGVPVDNFSNYSSSEEELLFVASMEEVKSGTLLFATSGSMVKQVAGIEFDVAKRTIAATKLVDDDKVVLVGLADAMDYVVLQSDDGYFLRFLKEEVPLKKKSAVGARGMKLGKTGLVEKAYLVANRMEYTIGYKEKEFVLNKLKLAKRDTKGTKVRI